MNSNGFLLRLKTLNAKGYVYPPPNSHPPSHPSSQNVPYRSLTLEPASPLSPREGSAPSPSAPPETLAWLNPWTATQWASSATGSQAWHRPSASYFLSNKMSFKYTGFCCVQLLTDRPARQELLPPGFPQHEVGQALPELSLQRLACLLATCFSFCSVTGTTFPTPKSSPRTHTQRLALALSVF